MDDKDFLRDIDVAIREGTPAEVVAFNKARKHDNFVVLSSMALLAMTIAFIMNKSL